MRKTRRKNCFRVSNSKTRRVFSKCTTKKKAIRQLRLLRYIDSRSGRETLRRRPNKSNKTQSKFSK